MRPRLSRFVRFAKYYRNVRPLLPKQSLTGSRNVAKARFSLSLSLIRIPDQTKSRSAIDSSGDFYLLSKAIAGWRSCRQKWNFCLPWDAAHKAAYTLTSLQRQPQQHSLLKRHDLSPSTGLRFKKAKKEKSENLSLTQATEVRRHHGRCFSRIGCDASPHLKESGTSLALW